MCSFPNTMQSIVLSSLIWICLSNAHEQIKGCRRIYCIDVVGWIVIWIVSKDTFETRSPHEWKSDKNVQVAARNGCAGERRPKEKSPQLSSQPLDMYISRYVRYVGELLSWWCFMCLMSSLLFIFLKQNCISSPWSSSCQIDFIPSVHSTNVCFAEQRK